MCKDLRFPRVDCAVRHVLLWLGLAQQVGQPLGRPAVYGYAVLLEAILLGQWGVKSPLASGRLLERTSLAYHSWKNNIYEDITPPLPHGGVHHSY